MTLIDEIYSFCVAEKFWLLGLERRQYRWNYLVRNFPDVSPGDLEEGLSKWEVDYLG